MTERLTIRGLTKRFGTVTALDGVDLTVAEGEVVAVIGESGSGKSTLARCAVGLTRPDAGAVWHGETDLATCDRRTLRALRRQAPLVFQDASLALDPRQRIGAAVAEARIVHGLPPRDDLLAPVGLPPELARRYPHELSGGQRQRVLLARALATEPTLLLLDEPTASLDTLTRADVLALLQNLVGLRGLAMLLITHDLPAAAVLAQRLVVLERGRVVESGPVASLIGRPTHPHTRALVAAAR